MIPPRPVHSADARDRAPAERLARDRALVQQVRTHDPAALAELLRAYGDWLARSALAVVGSPDLAQDVVQDVFVWLWNARDTLDIQGAVSSYLYRAVRNRAQNVVVHERSHRNIEARMHAEHDGREPRVENAGETNVMAQELHAALAEATQALQPRTREIFQMRMEGLSYAEIAEALEIGVPTVHTQMYRATRLLADRLAAWRAEGGRE